MKVFRHLHYCLTLDLLPTYQPINLPTYILTNIHTSFSFKSEISKRQLYSIAIWNCYPIPAFSTLRVNVWKVWSAYGSRSSSEFSFTNKAQKRTTVRIILILNESVTQSYPGLWGAPWTHGTLRSDAQATATGLRSCVRSQEIIVSLYQVRFAARHTPSRSLLVVEIKLVSTVILGRMFRTIVIYERTNIIKSTLSESDTFGTGLERCPSYRKSNRRSKERKGPTLGVRFTEVSIL